MNRNASRLVNAIQRGGVLGRENPMAGRVSRQAIGTGSRIQPSLTSLTMILERICSKLLEPVYSFTLPRLFGSL